MEAQTVDKLLSWVYTKYFQQYHQFTSRMTNQVCSADLNDITLVLYTAIAYLQHHFHEDVLPTPETSPYIKAVSALQTMTRKQLSDWDSTSSWPWRRNVPALELLGVWQTGWRGSNSEKRGAGYIIPLINATQNCHLSCYWLSSMLKMTQAFGDLLNILYP